MKKFLNIVLVASVLTFGSTCAFAKKTANDVDIVVKKDKEVVIVKPEKVKLNAKNEIKKQKSHAKTKAKSSQEAEGMYETKFPAINSRISYADMN